MKTKAHSVRAALGHVAEMRLRGDTWPRVAEQLSPDVAVTADEIRAYWGRYAAGRTPAEVALEAARAEAAEARAEAAEAAAAVTRWSADALESRERAISAIQAEHVAHLAQERDRARAEEQRALEAQAALRSQLASVNRKVEQLRPVAEARARASVELGKAEKERDRAVATAAGWERWARELLRLHDAGELNSDALKANMDAVRNAGP